MELEKKTETEVEVERFEGGVYYGFASYGKLLLFFPSPEHKCKIGRYCSIGGGSSVIMKGNHHIDWVTSYPFSAPGIRDIWPNADHGKQNEVAWGKGDVLIGSDVWMGANVTILSGVTIGDGAAIATQSVITKNVPPYAVVAGNPASVKKYRFDEETVKKLLEIKWWNWPKEKVNEAVNLLQSPDMKGFIEKYHPLVSEEKKK